MSCTDLATSPSDASAAQKPLREQIEELRQAVETLGGATKLARLVSSIAAEVDLVQAEHAGMATELLAVYEQLGVVFEVTRRLPSVKGESDVVDLFVDCLRQSFGDSEVFVVPAGDCDDPEAGDGAATGWFHDLVQGARTSGTVVERPPAGTMPDAIHEVMVAPLFAGDAFIGGMVLTRGRGGEAFRACDMMLVESLTTFYGDLIRNQRLTRELGRVSTGMVRALVNAVDQKDEYTCGHSIRVGYFATMLGRAAGLNNEELQTLQWSALLHDVGKIGIRDDVLKKPGKLTAEEFAHIQEHPVRSHEVVKEVPQLAAALPGVLHHHERYNGKGYPAKLAGEDIPLQARLIQIADVFDALTSTRSYRPAFEWEPALDILERDAGSAVDPKLQELFDGLIRRAIGDDPNGWAELVRSANGFGAEHFDQDGESLPWS